MQAGYDVEGRRTWHRVRGPAGAVLTETMQYDARGKLLLAESWRPESGTGRFQQWYSGSGNLAATDWQELNTSDRETEEYVSDALGNVVVTRTGNALTQIGAVGNEPRYKGYEPGVARVRDMGKVRPPVWSTSFQQDSTWQWYDGPGNMLGSRSYSAAAQSESQTKQFYGADDRLRAVQRISVRNEGENFNQKHSGVWEEYRHDPLGRRIMVRTRTDAGLCDVDPWTCTGSITRFVWAGDQILWELKAPGNGGANLEATTGSGNAYGQVSYTHASGIDRPLVITKNGVSVIPHQNWRGMFALATNPTGGLDVPDVDWPGYHTTPWHGPTRVVENWFGSLSTGMRDASGQMYMRNRYYDPASGQFTQPDPIGLAGGLNSYGFAAGDPVTYSDPYGLTAGCDERKEAESGRLCPVTVVAQKPFLTRFRERINRLPQGIRELIRNLPDVVNPADEPKDLNPPDPVPGIEHPAPPTPGLGGGPPKPRTIVVDGEEWEVTEDDGPQSMCGPGGVCVGPPNLLPLLRGLRDFLGRGGGPAVPVPLPPLPGLPPIVLP